MSKNKPVDYSKGVKFTHPDSATVYIVTTESDAVNLIRSGWHQVSASVRKKPVKGEGE